MHKMDGSETSVEMKTEMRLGDRAAAGLGTIYRWHCERGLSVGCHINEAV